MAVNSSSNNGGTSQQANDTMNSPFNRSQTSAQLIAEIGRCLRSVHQASLAEPMSVELAVLMHQLQEQQPGPDPTTDAPARISW